MIGTLFAVKMSMVTFASFVIIAENARATNYER
jgi:hypothetical protein